VEVVAMIFKRKPVVEYEPVLPEGWTLKVRQQEKSYCIDWDYRLTPPTRIMSVYQKTQYNGTAYSTRRAAIISAVDTAEFIERNYRNELEKWETV
jgi:hypothetical protein